MARLLMSANAPALNSVPRSEEEQGLSPDQLSKIARLGVVLSNKEARQISAALEDTTVRQQLYRCLLPAGEWRTQQQVLSAGGVPVALLASKLSLGPLLACLPGVTVRALKRASNGSNSDSSDAVAALFRLSPSALPAAEEERLHVQNLSAQPEASPSRLLPAPSPSPPPPVEIPASVSMAVLSFLQSHSSADGSSGTNSWVSSSAVGEHLDALGLRHLLGPGRRVINAIRQIPGIQYVVSADKSDWLFRLQPSSYGYNGNERSVAGAESSSALTEVSVSPEGPDPYVDGALQSIFRDHPPGVHLSLEAIEAAVVKAKLRLGSPTSQLSQLLDATPWLEKSISRRGVVGYCFDPTSPEGREIATQEAERLLCGNSPFSTAVLNALSACAEAGHKWVSDQSIGQQKPVADEASASGCGLTDVPGVLSRLVARGWAKARDTDARSFRITDAGKAALDGMKRAAQAERQPPRQTSRSSKKANQSASTSGHSPLPPPLPAAFIRTVKAALRSAVGRWMDTKAVARASAGLDENFRHYVTSDQQISLLAALKSICKADPSFEARCHGAEDAPASWRFRCKQEAAAAAAATPAAAAVAELVSTHASSSPLPVTVSAKQTPVSPAIAVAVRQILRTAQITAAVGCSGKSRYGGWVPLSLLEDLLSSDEALRSAFDSGASISSGGLRSLLSRLPFAKTADNGRGGQGFAAMRDVVSGPPE